MWLILLFLFWKMVKNSPQIKILLSYFSFLITNSPNNNTDYSMHLKIVQENHIKHVRYCYYTKRLLRSKLQCTKVQAYASKFALRDVVLFFIIKLHLISEVFYFLPTIFWFYQIGVLWRKMPFSRFSPRWLEFFSFGVGTQVSQVSQVPIVGTCFDYSKSNWT